MCIVVSTLSSRCLGSHGARPVQQSISMIKWIRTRRLSIKNYFCCGWSQEWLTRGTANSTMRRPAHPSGSARCSAGAGSAAKKYSSLPRLGCRVGGIRVWVDALGTRVQTLATRFVRVSVDAQPSTLTPPLTLQPSNFESCQFLRARGWRWATL